MTRAVEAALASSDPRADAALDLLVVHAAGVLDRAHTRVTEATQIDAMTRVLCRDQP